MEFRDVQRPLLPFRPGLPQFALDDSNRELADPSLKQGTILSAAPIEGGVARSAARQSAPHFRRRDVTTVVCQVMAAKAAHHHPDSHD
jgi:hypothetical protein